MHVTVYLDVIFFVNFVMDCLVLAITNYLLRQRVPWWRILLGGLAGAFTLLLFVPGGFMFKPIIGTIIFIGISFEAIVISFGLHRGNMFVKWLLSTTLMVLLGNGMNYIRYILNLTVLDLCTWLVCVSIAVIFIVFVLNLLRKKFEMSQNLYMIQIKHEGKLVLEQCFMDTGNMLKDPYLQRPVIILSESVVKACITGEEAFIVDKYLNCGLLEYENLLSNEIQMKHFFHEIPYMSVGKIQGKMLCFLMDEIEILDNKQKMYKQPVAVGPDVLFRGKTYKGLLQPECISI